MSNAIRIGNQIPDSILPNAEQKKCPSSWNAEGKRITRDREDRLRMDRLGLTELPLMRP